MTGPLPSGALEILRQFPLFSDLEEEYLEHLGGMAKHVLVHAGTSLFEEGTQGDRFYVILEGEMEVTRQEGGQTVTLAVLGPGGFLSEMSLLESRPRTASARALQDTALIAIEPEHFRDLLHRSPGAAMNMLKTVTARLRSTESSLVEHGRLAGLGTLAAGLAHELNNPATAMLRSSSLLHEAMAAWGERCAEVLRDRRELGIEAWMEEEGLDDAWRFAPTLADAGWSREELVSLGLVPGSPHAGPILRWAAAGADAFGLAEEIKKAAEAVSSIVGGVRSYSQLDRGPVQVIDIAESIANTLAIMKGKIGNRIMVVQDLSPDLPPIEAVGGGLSQVWTNLIDNALDAMGGEGTLEIRGRKSEEGVVVEIVDSGSGIPPEIRPCIFDPFYTTKPQGSGTGLGLAISYGIVVNRHRGTIRVESRPGRTKFEVALPIRLASPEGNTKLPEVT
jgi:signal transduction histidine kinase